MNEFLCLMSDKKKVHNFNLYTRFQHQITPTEGMIRKNSHLRIAQYHQHLHELLDLDLSPLDYMQKCFPQIKEREEMRRIIGRYGLSGKQQVSPPLN
jgi:ATP-binding cassette subfamily F protein 2